MKKFITNKYILYLIGIIFFTFVWWLLSILIGEQTLVFPGPVITLKEVFKILQTKYIYKCLSITFIRMLIGYGISLILAIILGTIAGNKKYIKEILKPSIVVLKAIPTAAILFLFLVLLGAKHAPIIIVSLISFPILYESVVGGYENIEKNIIDAMKIDGENNIKNILKVKLPLSIPYILIGIAILSVIVVLFTLLKKFYDDYYYLKHDREMRKIENARFAGPKKKKRPRKKDMLFK